LQHDLYSQKIKMNMAPQFSAQLHLLSWLVARDHGRKHWLAKPNSSTACLAAEALQEMLQCAVPWLQIMLNVVQGLQSIL
jgi:hypothetical protein